MPRFNPVKDIPDLTGRVAIVTGANSGLGYQTAQQLANHGVKLYLTTRSEAKALDTIRRLEEGNPALKDSDRLQYLVVDFSLVKNAQAAAEEFLRRESRLDILVNNAGMSVGDFTITSEGISLIFAADHVSPFVFTITLLPLLEATAKQPGTDVRIVTISSIAHFNIKRAKFDSIEDFRDNYSSGGKVNSTTANLARSGQAKLANILFAKELQRQLDAAGVPIISVSLHPGAVVTEGFESSIQKLGFGFIWPLLRWVVLVGPLQGTITQLFAATSPEVRKDADRFKGQYLLPYGKVAPAKQMSDLAKNPELPGQLWAMTERVVKEILEKGSV
ncbi:NAD-P-binding protein [Calocera viscosa TUFC12733]|uniref:NAD-P-binding protein n=1 Tax=Calocera viscosa (strain TUFC12733) TaxID=1330018 RepID=A0A167HRF4_CALVF|nr:NAD-P-binding protein [Calocera viscosa TUFC12733]